MQYGFEKWNKNETKQKQKQQCICDYKSMIKSLKTYNYELTFKKYLHIISKVYLQKLRSDSGK